MSDAGDCTRCDGCGKIADSDDGEPWSVWMALPAQAAVAVFAGLVKPIPCPVCGGTGRQPEPPPVGNDDWGTKAEEMIDRAVEIVRGDPVLVASPEGQRFLARVAAEKVRLATLPATGERAG